MSEITKYVLVDENDNQSDHQYDSLHEAQAAADGSQAILAQVYEYSDSELVYTPDGSDTWPPEKTDD